MLRIVLAATLLDALRFLRLFLIKYVRMGELRLDHIAAHRTQDRIFLGRAAGMIRKMRREIALFRAALRLARMPVAAFIL